MTSLRPHFWVLLVEQIDFIYRCCDLEGGKIGGQPPHEACNFHFVGLVVFYCGANTYVYKERLIKVANINIL